MAVGILTETWKQMGRVIFQAGRTKHSTIERGVEPVPAESIFIADGNELLCWNTTQCGGPSGFCPNIAQFTHYYPVTIVDSAQYGLGELESGEYGFLPPLIRRVERPDGLFCNGFESCPAKE